MVRAALVLCVVAACGRIEFDPVSDDRDGDGLADTIDLCPDFASDNQHDEDADGVGDVCDPCPHLVGDAADADGDGVGDACDLRPDVAGEKIRAFFTFTETELPIGWTEVTTGTASADEEWMIGGDLAHLALTADHVAMLGVTGPVATDVRIETELVIEAVSPPGGNGARNFAIIDNYNMTTDTGLLMGAVMDYGQSPPGDADILFVLNSIGNQVLATAPLEAAFRIGETYQLTYTRRGDTRFYTLRGGEGTRELQAVRTDANGSLGIRARGLTVGFRNLIVIY